MRIFLLGGEGCEQLIYEISQYGGRWLKSHQLLRKNRVHSPEKILATPVAENNAGQQIKAPMKCNLQ